MKKYFLSFFAVTLSVFFTFLFVFANDGPPAGATFCHELMGGPGVCEPNPEGGFHCKAAGEGILGDCEGTYWKPIITEEEGGGE